MDFVVDTERQYRLNVQSASLFIALLRWQASGLASASGNDLKRGVFWLGRCFYHRAAILSLAQACGQLRGAMLRCYALGRAVELFDLKVAAKRLGASVDHVRALVEDGRLRYVNIGRGSKRPRYRFTEADLNEFIETNRARGEAPCPSSRLRKVRITNSTSCSVAIGFTAQRNARVAKKRSASKP